MNHVEAERISVNQGHSSGADNVRLLTLVSPALRISGVSLGFEVTRDQEYVRVRMYDGGRVVDMGERGHNYLLLILARQRVKDMKEGHSETSCGWMYRDDLTRDPTMPSQMLNLHVFRLRQQFAKTDIVDPFAIIERRRLSGQLRIGTAHLSIVEV